MTSIFLSREDLQTLRENLFREGNEQAAFGYADWDPSGSFSVSAIEVIPQEGFAFQSDYHIELSSETQARVIKRAFDMQSSLIEFHSHRTNWPAQFSPTDFAGFSEFVPHVRWRLAGRPYAAIVFHESSYDGLAWIDTEPVQIDRIESPGQFHPDATGLSLRALMRYHDD